MSLIYNSLKQHEKQARTQKINPISERMSGLDERSFSKSSIWLPFLGITLVIIIVLVIIQNYWSYPTKNEDVDSVNHLISASKAQASSEQSQPLYKETSLKHEALPLPSNGVTDADSYEENFALKQNKERAVESGVETFKPFVEIAREEVTRPVIKVKTEFAQVKPLSGQSLAKVEVIPEPIGNSEIQEKEAINDSVVEEEPLQVKKAQAKSIMAKAETTPKPVVSNLNIERKVVATNPQEPSRNSIEYFMAVKSKVLEIKQFIRLNNHSAVQVKLNELEKLSGKESVIYQRMNAYASLKDQRYQQAANSYQKLLNQKPEDMEANMNLVIALAELGDQETARKQLNRLDSLYPESNQLKKYKKMIHAKYGY